MNSICVTIPNCKYFRSFQYLKVYYCINHNLFDCHFKEIDGIYRRENATLHLKFKLQVQFPVSDLATITKKARPFLDGLFSGCKMLM